MKRSQDERLTLETEQFTGSLATIPIASIQPNPYQPRRDFSQEKIEELAQSIKTHGLLQPVIVRRSGKSYQLVVGERRLIACRSLGWLTITATVKELGDSAMAAIALIENLQRENLSFIEEALGYARLLQEFKFTQEALAQRLGKSQSAIANKLRLLKLTEKVRQEIAGGNLTERHARALLRLPAEEQQLKVIEEITRKGLTVQQTEERIEEISNRIGALRADKRRKPKVIIRDVRIFLNTIKQAVKIMERAGLSPVVYEHDNRDYYEVTIKLSKEQ